ncbi:MAG: hypothetical protein IPN98_11170 [Propionivibrio sp.]|nr:hypothetical protein [Propionivibrio sp.]
MNDAGLTWEGFCQEVEMQQAMVPELPVGFAMTIIERPKPKDPESLLRHCRAVQTWSEPMTIPLLRTLLPH